MPYNYFTAKVRYSKTMESGKEKKVSELYLVDALSFTEAESRIIEEASAFISGEFTVSDIKRANYAEYFFCVETDAEKYFACRLEFITINEKDGKEKKTKQNVLVQASDLRDAMNRLSEIMKGTISDYNALSIKETAILDVFKYIPSKND